MSRITAIACSYTDMEWYGVDRKGNIAVFCSAGIGNLPEFVCADEERADKLIDHFEMLDKTTNSQLLFKGTEQSEQVAKDFSSVDRVYVKHAYE